MLLLVKTTDKKKKQDNCNNCKKALCSLKVALEKGWVIGAARDFKTAKEVIEESGLVCAYHSQ